MSSITARVTKDLYVVKTNNHVPHECLSRLNTDDHFFLDILSFLSFWGTVTGLFSLFFWLLVHPSFKWWDASELSLGFLSLLSTLSLGDPIWTHGFSPCQSVSSALTSPYNSSLPAQHLRVRC